MDKIAIIDDEISVIKDITQLVEAYNDNIRCCSFQTGEQLIKAVKEGNFFDVYIIDVFLDDVNGIELIKTMKSIHENALFIIISGQPRDLFDVYDVDHLYFLEKPIDKEKFYKALSKIEDYENNKCLNFVFIRCNYRIPFKDIVYIENAGRKVIINTMNNSYQHYAKMDDLLAILPPNFVRLHKSYIVNVEYIREYSNTYVKLSNGKYISISKPYRKKK